MPTDYNEGAAFRSEEDLEQERREQELLEQLQLQMEEDQEELYPTPEEPAPTPQPSMPSTEGQPKPTTTPTSTEPVYSGKTVEINGQQYPAEDIQWDTNIFGQKVANLTPEAARRRQREKGNEVTYLGQDISETNTQVKERLSAPTVGTADFGIDFINAFLPKEAKIPKPTPYEDGMAEAVRKISSVVVPTLLLQGAGMAAGALAQARVGWSVGKTAFMRFLGARGVEAAAGAIVGSVSSEYEGENLTGMAKKALPPQWDFIPDNWATLDTDSADIKRQKNINEDLSLGFIIPFAGSLGKLGAAVDDVRNTFRPISITGDTPKAQAWLKANAPEDSIRAQARKLYDSSTLDDGTIIHRAELQNDFNSLSPKQQEELIKTYTEEGLIVTDPGSVDAVHYAIKQDDALEELGYYNYATNPQSNTALKGVHNDLFEWNEVGMRTVDDFGVVGASIDAARIANNAGTVNGRLGSIVSYPALKYGLQLPEAGDEIVMSLTRQLKDADRVSMAGPGWNVTYDDVQAAGDNLVRELFDPSMTPERLREVLEPFTATNEYGATVLTEEGYSGVFKAIRGYASDYAAMDVAKAQAYLATSLSGQVADLAEGIRLNRESASVLQAKDKIRDNLAFLMKLKGTTSYYAGRKLNMMNMWSRFRSMGKTPKQITEEIQQGYSAAVARMQQEAEIFSENLDWMNRNNPEMVDSFLEMYELTDGKINSVNKLSEDIKNSFVNVRPLLDNNPDAPNLLVGAVRANFFNSILSSGGTASKALYGNLSGLVFEPISYFGGALLRRDLESVQRGWMAYSAIFDTQRKSLSYAGKLFMKASQNPASVADQTRLDYIIKQEERIEIYKQLAEAEAAKGNWGLKYLVDQYEMMQHMAEDPVFRIVPNLFTGFDGYTGSMLANAEARFRAMDAIQRQGDAITPGEVKRIADKEYDSMFDSQKNLIMDEAVKYNTSELALNVDTPLAQSLNSLVKQIPALRPFLLFPTTQANMLKQFGDFGPFVYFSKDLNDLAYTPIKTFMEDDELVTRVLTSRGYNVESMDQIAKINTITDLKNKTLGKKAIATLVWTSAIGLIIKDRLTGDGLYDRTAQRSREQNSNWERRTVVLDDGSRVEYSELFGPGLGNWIAMVANIADNFDMLSETQIENLGKKMIFILGGSITDQAVMSSLRPVVEMLSGNEPAFNRWAAGQINALGPLGGLRAEMGRVINGGLREVERDLASYIANRNLIINNLDEANRLPYVYNPITGEIPNQYSFLQRLWNAYMPIKIHPGMTPEEQFLVDIEYDVSTGFATREGVELFAKERSELFRLMGERGYFKDRIKAIASEARSRKTIEELKAARAQGFTSEEVPIENYDMIHSMLRQAQRDAENLAFNDLDSDMYLDIQTRQLKRDEAKSLAEMGIIFRK